MNRPLTGIRADRKQGYRSIELMASGLRTMLGLDPSEQFNSLQFFDQIIPEMTVECAAGQISLCEAVIDCREEGRTRWDGELNKLEFALSDRTYEMLQQGHVRARSTVAHETGHACLHIDQIIRMGGMSLVSTVAFHREKGSHEACQDTEWQANAFGSALLMPAEGVQSLLNKYGMHSEALIAAVYGVSMESAHYRIATYERALGK